MWISKWMNPSRKEFWCESMRLEVSELWEENLVKKYTRSGVTGDRVTDVHHRYRTVGTLGGNYQRRWRALRREPLVIPPPHWDFLYSALHVVLALCQEADPSTHNCLGLHCAACVLSVGEGPESLSKHTAFCKLSSASTGRLAQQLHYLPLFWLSALRLQQF